MHTSIYTYINDNHHIYHLVYVHYPRWPYDTIYAMMEIAVIGSDIQVAYMTIYIHIHIHMNYP